VTTDVTGAMAALRTRAEAVLTALPLFWQDEDNAGALPDTPRTFVYFELDTLRPFLAGFGGGRSNNLYRNPAELHGFVFVPIGQGLPVALAAAETVAAAFRSYRSAGNEVSCFEASVHPVGKGAEIVPQGLSSAAGNYACAVAIVVLQFDQVG
jgi:hypothetical protein